MNITRIAEIIVVGLFRLSPYAWIDGLLLWKQNRDDEAYWKAWRYKLSSMHINFWLFASVLKRGAINKCVLCDKLHC